MLAHEHMLPEDDLLTSESSSDTCRMWWEVVEGDLGDVGFIWNSRMIKSVHCMGVVIRTLTSGGCIGRNTGMMMMS